MQFVFDRFNYNLFTANHLANLASTPFIIPCTSFKLLPAQNIFVSSAKSINLASFDTLQISLIICKNSSSYDMRFLNRWTTKVFSTRVLDLYFRNWAITFV